MLDERISERLHWQDPINITKGQWLFLLEDRKIITEQDTHLLQFLYDYMFLVVHDVPLAGITEGEE